MTAAKAALPAILLLAALARIAGLIAYGPGLYPDSHEYLAYAALIRGSDHSWLWDAGLERSMAPVTVARTIGYPMVLAILQALFGSSFAVATVLLQSALALTATAAVYRFALRFTGALWAAIAAGIGHGLSHVVWLDLALLADSLFTSLFILATITLGHLLLGGAARPLRAASGIGAVAALLILLRGNGWAVAATLAPLALAAILFSRTGRLYRAGMIVAFLLPGLLIVWTYRTWNEARSGEAFLTTNAQVVMLQSVFEMVHKGARPFDGDTPLDRAVRETASGYTLAEVVAANRQLHVRYGMTAPAIADAATAKYVETIRRFPGPFLTATLENFDLKSVAALVNPAFGFAETHQIATEVSLLPGLRELRREPGTYATPLRLGLLALHAACALGSILLFLAFLFGAPILALGRWRRCGPADRDAAMLAGLWLAYAGVAAMYMAVHFELRYVLSVAPVPVLGGSLVIERLRILRKENGPPWIRRAV
ncbi:MAG: hypothetical protein AB7G39_05590 [Alphaproteobacteria bacterium]